MTETTISLVRPATSVAPFLVEEHLQGVIESLLNLRRSEGLYPPKGEVKANANPTDLAYWLLNEDVLARWVAVVHGQVVGHISITEPRPHLTDVLTGTASGSVAMSGVCISKFFVDPRAQSQGAGALLFDQALRFSRRQGLQLAATVDPASLAARRFFGQHGMVESESPQGIRGKTFVFVDNPASYGWESAVAGLAA